MTHRSNPNEVRTAGQLFDERQKAGARTPAEKEKP